MTVATAEKTFYLLSAAPGWRVGRLDGAVVSAGEGSLILQAVPGSGQKLVDSQGSFGGLTQPVGIAIDATGRIYVLDSEPPAVRSFDPCTCTFEVLPCVGGEGAEPRQLSAPRGLAVAACGDLYIADTGNLRVQVFSLKGLALRAMVEPPFRVSPGASGTPPGAWEPWDVAAARNRMYVCDHLNGAIQVFDAHARWIAAFDGAGQGQPAFAKPSRIAVDSAGLIYVIEEGKASVRILDRHGLPAGQVDTADQVTGTFCATGVAVDDKGNLCLTNGKQGGVQYLDSSQSGGRLIACSGFQGAAAAVAFDRGGNLIVSDAGGRCVTLLPAGVAYVQSGAYLSQPLDSHRYACQWDRVSMTANVPLGTSLAIATLTSEAPKGADEVLALPADRWSSMTVDPGVEGWDCAVMSPPGRYLWLRLTLTGNGPATPSVKEAAVYFPRSGSIDYLPAVYRQDAPSADFLARFLGVFDAIRGGITDRVGDVAGYFDPWATPAGDASGRGDFLGWLGTWLGLAVERRWTETTRRRLVAMAHRLFALRGTPEGMRLHFQLYTGVEPRILEHFKLRRWLALGSGRAGDQQLFGAGVMRRLQLDVYDRIGDVQLIDTGDALRDPFSAFANQFTVFVPGRAAKSADDLQTLERILEMASPAQAQGRLEVVAPRFRIGVQAFVGIDTVIGCPPQGSATGTAQLGYDTVLAPSADESEPPMLRVGIRSRIGSTTVMN